MDDFERTRLKSSKKNNILRYKYKHKFPYDHKNNKKKIPRNLWIDIRDDRNFLRSAYAVVAYFVHELTKN